MSSAPAGKHLILYDGVCGLCDRLVRFVIKHDEQRVFCFAPIQSSTGRRFLGAYGKDPYLLDTFYVVQGYQSRYGRLLSRASAALFFVSSLGWPWRLISILQLLPARLLDRVYDYIATNRYRFYGRYETCFLPDRSDRNRFIDV